MSGLDAQKAQRILYLGLIVSLGLGTVSLGQFGSGNLRLWEVLLAIYCTLSFLQSFSSGKFIIVGARTLYSILAFWCAALFSGIAAMDVELWTKQMTLLTAMLILCLVTSQNGNVSKTISDFRWLSYSGALIAAFGIFQLYWRPGDLQSYSGLEVVVPRARAFFAEANEFSQFLVLPFAFSLVLLVCAPTVRWFERITLSTAIIVIVIAQLLTFSRGGVLAFLIEGALVILISMRMRVARQMRRTSKFVQILALVSGCGMVLILSSWFLESSIGIAWERISSLFSGSDTTSTIRWDNYLDALRRFSMAQFAPMTGIGFGDLPRVLQDGVATTANFLVDIYAETGLVGLVSYLVILYKALSTGFDFLRRQPMNGDSIGFVSVVGPLVALCGLIAGGLTYATHMLNFFWFVCGMLLAFSVSPPPTPFRTGAVQLQ